jgi:hypothetical protein
MYSFSNVYLILQSKFKELLNLKEYSKFKVINNKKEYFSMIKIKVLLN